MNKMVDDMIIKCNDSKKVLSTLLEYTDPIHPETSDEEALVEVGQMFQLYVSMICSLNSAFSDPLVVESNYAHFCEQFRILVATYIRVRSLCKGCRIDSSLDKYLDSQIC